MKPPSGSASGSELLQINYSVASLLGSDRVNITLRSGSSFGSITRTIYPPAKYLVLSASDMGQIFAGGSNHIQISLYFSKTEFRQIDGKVFQIENAIDVWKNDAYIKE